MVPKKAVLSKEVALLKRELNDEVISSKLLHRCAHIKEVMKIDSEVIHLSIKKVTVRS